MAEASIAAHDLWSSVVVLEELVEFKRAYIAATSYAVPGSPVLVTSRLKRLKSDQLFAARPGTTVPGTASQ